MGRKVIVSSGAFGDMDDLRNFYERQERGLGDYFARVVFTELHSLAIYAGTHPVRTGGYHRMIVRRFHLSIHYSITPETVTVYAVLDARRNPTKTTRRLKPKRPRP